MHFFIAKQKFYKVNTKLSTLIPGEKGPKSIQRYASYESFITLNINTKKHT